MEPIAWSFVDSSFCIMWLIISQITVSIKDESQSPGLSLSCNVRHMALHILIIIDFISSTINSQVLMAPQNLQDHHPGSQWHLISTTIYIRPMGTTSDHISLHCTKQLLPTLRRWGAGQFKMLRRMLSWTAAIAPAWLPWVVSGLL